MAHTCAMRNPIPNLPTGCQPSNLALRGASPGPYYLGHCIQFRLTISHSNCNQCHLQAKEVTAGIACQPILQRLHSIKLLTRPGYDVKSAPFGISLVQRSKRILCRSQITDFSIPLRTRRESFKNFPVSQCFAFGGRANGLPHLAPLRSVCLTQVPIIALFGT